jgi:hypothetical protein
MLNLHTVMAVAGGRWQPLLACCLLFSGMAWSQALGSGKVSVTATVQGSIGLVFNNDANVGTNGYCPLTNAGTNNVGLDFGTASYTGGDSLACVGFIQFLGTYILTSRFDVVVSESNSTSANYNLAAKVAVAPPANVEWFINLTQLTTAFTTFQNNNNYGQSVVEALSAVVNQNVAAGTLDQEIDFQATAN